MQLLVQLTIWGVDLAGVSGDAAPSKQQSVVLLKFLRARKFVVDQALDMLLNCLKVTAPYHKAA